MKFEMPCELDAAGVRSCREAVEKLAVAPGNLLLDFSRVTEMDSSGLGLLVHLHKRKRQRGCRLEIQNATGQPMALLEQFKLLGIMGCKVDNTPVARPVLQPLPEFSRVANSTAQIKR